MPPFFNSTPKSVTRISMFWTQAKRLYLNFNLSFEYQMYAIRIRILKSKFENLNFVSHGMYFEVFRHYKTGILQMCVVEVELLDATRNIII